MNVRTLHLISMHTSPLSQPGNGDAGGMNVYIASLVKAMLALDSKLSIEIFTLDSSSSAGTYRQTWLGENCVVHTLVLDQARGAAKEDLSAYISAFAREVSSRALATPDIVHTHYWLSGMAARLYAPQVPWVHTMHTTAAAKNAKAGAGEPLEPQERFNAEQVIVDECSALVVNTEYEAEQMREFYRAGSSSLHTVQPGVDTEIFYPKTAHSVCDSRGRVLFAGRPQPLKGPHILVEALALLPQDMDVSLTMIGQSHSNYEDQLLQRAHELGVASRLTILPAMVATDLAEQMRLADIVACPSSSETFGLVALEAQATATAVLATAVDGLKDAVVDGVTGVLVADREPQSWADAIAQLVSSPRLREKLGRAGAKRAASMGWAQAAEKSLALYEDLVKIGRV